MRIGFIGLGTMGAPMAARLLRAGFTVTVHNRTRDREVPLAEQGAGRAASPREAAVGADVVVTVVSDTPDVEQVLFGPDGAAEGLREGAVVIDMSTIAPAATRSMAERLAARGVRMLDAPVSGGSEGAVQGTLSIMVGGDEGAWAEVRGVLAAMGRVVTHVGGPGSGQVAKAMNQVIIAGTYAAVAEGIALGLRSGIDVGPTLQALGGGAAGSWVLEHRARNMIANEYPLGFRVRLHRKDLGIALEAARGVGVPMPVAAYVEQLETGLIARGFGDDDVSAIARSVRDLAGID